VSEDLELVDLTAGELETVPSHCQVVRWSDGSLRAEIWMQRTGCDAGAWDYVLVKLP
jgi:hypothetical protein